MRKHISSLLVVSGLALTSVTAVLAQKTPTLYDNLGGKKAITAVVDEFVARVAADNRINAFFKQTASDPKRLASFQKPSWSIRSARQVVVPANTRAKT